MPQQCRRDPCHISKRYEFSNLRSRHFDVSRDLTVSVLLLSKRSPVCQDMTTTYRHSYSNKLRYNVYNPALKASQSDIRTSWHHSNVNFTVKSTYWMLLRCMLVWHLVFYKDTYCVRVFRPLRYSTLSRCGHAHLDRLPLHRSPGLRHETFPSQINIQLNDRNANNVRQNVVVSTSHLLVYLR